MKKKIILSSVGVVVLVGAGFLFFGGSKNSDEDKLPRVKVTKGNIIDKALAVGTIEPENEISVKSKVSGAVSRIYADAGTYVKAGQPLLEVRRILRRSSLPKQSGMWNSPKSSWTT